MGQSLELKTRMRPLVLLCALAGIALASEASFNEFAKTFNKKYASTEEYAKRREIFMDNYKLMLKHNQEYEEGKVSWWKKVTEYYDMTHEEWMNHMKLGMPPMDESIMFNSVDEAMEAKIAERSAPDSWNWKDQGAITSIKDQQQCGSCAAFAAVAAADSCMWMASNSLYDDLSEQHLMDCANGHFSYDDEGSWGAFGCDGAWPQAYYDWVIKQNDGRLEKEDCAPYQAKDRTCVDDDSCNYMGAHMTGFWNKWHTTEDEMKELVFQAPVATTVYASYFGDYGGGVYEDSRCCEADSDPNCIWTLNHEVTVIGYGHESGKDYWLVKNSWGDRWGDNGYIKIKRGSGHCGIGRQHVIQPYCAIN